MTRQFPRLLLTTALCLPIATASFAQSDAACEDLGVALNDGLPESLSGDAQRITDVQAAGDPAACDVELVAIKSVTEGSDQASDEETLAETDQLTVKLQDEMTVQGMVYLDRQPANVDIAGGDTEVSVTSEQPDVTVTEGQANIVIRQAAANVVVEMPQPTIRIEQPAPEVIITMPAPGVDVRKCPAAGRGASGQADGHRDAGLAEGRSGTGARPRGRGRVDDRDRPRQRQHLCSR